MQQNHVPISPSTSRSRHSYGEVLAKFREDVSPAGVKAILTRHDLTIVRELPQIGVVELAVASDRMDDLLQALRHDPSVDYAEPSFVAHGLGAPNDPRWPEQWNLVLVGAKAAWEITTGSADVTIAFLDTGLTLDHPDLEAKLWTNEGETPDNGVDDDHNGKADDVHGWHFYTTVQGGQLVSREDNDVGDDNGHGTHVAGIAAAGSNNGIGIAGLSWGARIMPVKVLDEYAEGWYADIVAGILYAADNGADIINMSLGGTEDSQALGDAVSYAYDRGAILVAAAGNDGGSLLYPAVYDEVLAVGAVDRDDQRASFSNHGPELDVVAPGVDVLSTWWVSDSYFRRSGTSMAAAHVSGVVALILSADPCLSNVQVGDLVRATAVDLGEPGRDAYYGFGRLDAHAAVSSVAVPTATPTPSPVKSYLPSVVH